jgi:hypothetical protein
MSKKQKYLQVFKNDYSNEFHFIKKSNKGVHYAFCEECRTDISISHGGRHDIVQHISMKKHINNVEANNAKNSKISSFFNNKDNKDEITRAECLFTAFFIEHNLPLSCSDHIGPLLRKIFPNHEIGQKYSCARTKTSAIVSEWASSSQMELISTLQSRPFSLATDGSNESDSKLYPIVATYFNSNTGKIENNLLAVPVLKGESTGSNISHLLLNKLNQLNVPVINCIGFSSDNAPVMVGKKSGVLTMLREHQQNLISVGCPCHLLNLAAEKGASCLPINVDELLVDMFYYFKKSSKRKEQLEKFQELYNDDVKKILKHVQTRWLSTTKCLQRILYLWEPLIAFFKDEMEKTKSKNACKSNLDFFTIPKKSENSSKVVQDQGKSVINEKSPKGKSVIYEKSVKRKQNSNDDTEHRRKKQKSDNFEQRLSVLSREERLFYLLTSDINKAYCLFLLYISPAFEKLNITLQGQSPLVDRLLSLLYDFLKQILLKFVKAKIIKESSDLLTLNYHSHDNQKGDDELLIGESTREVVQNLKSYERKEFFAKIRNYYVRCCDYINLKFPFRDEVLRHAEVCNIENLPMASFTSIKFFIERFPVFIKGNLTEELDQLNDEFCALQIAEIPQHVTAEERTDVKWHLISKIKNPMGEEVYKKICDVMLGILSIPHSNAECERIFSLVRKNRTEFRSSMLDESLESILLLKSNFSGRCYEQKFDSNFLKRAKSATCSKLKNKM